MLDFQPIEVLMVVFVAVFAVLFVAVVVFIVVSATRSRAALKAGGLDPLAAEAQLAVQAAHSGLLAPAQSLEQRLAELDDLQARGVITADEQQAARAQLLASPSG
ncbi:MAG TPA: SHOCT domain-containing protein [Actinomycetes bacterium]|nr:SHOCT domain-containing protein [Actinomycetes bacterium]